MLSSALAVALALALPLALGGCGGSPRARTVVLISIDTLRPERLGVYGNAPDVSPAIDAFAREAVVFDAALATAPWTLPSHMSMLTGLDPLVHGVRFSENKLAGSVTTLAERMQESGYRTAAFTDGGFVSRTFGFERGFEVFDDERDDAPGARNGFARLLPKALAWLAERRDDDLFLFLHTYDAHAPYDEGDPEVLERFRARPTPDGPLDPLLAPLRYLTAQAAIDVPTYGRLSELLNDYDAGVHEADRGVGEVLRALRASGRWEDALVIVTSDHGESFLDHGGYVGHGLGLRNDELRVPLLVKFPWSEGAGTRSSALVDLLDLAPTVLEGAHARPAGVLQGESLYGLARGGARSRHSVFATCVNTGCFCLVRDGYKYLSPYAIDPMIVARVHLGPVMPEGLEATRPHCAYTMSVGDTEVELVYDWVADPLGLRDVLLPQPCLYDLAADPREEHNLFAEQQELAQRMSAELKSIVVASQALADRAGDRTNTVGIARRQEQQLAQLGYLATHSSAALDELAPELQQALLEPFHPPDTSALAETDRGLHGVRLRLRDGLALDDASRAALRGAGPAYLAWSQEHPVFKVRAQWRILELRRLAEQAGVDLLETTWAAQARAIREAHPKSPSR